MDKIVITTYDELKSLFTETLQNYLPTKEKEPALPDKISLKEALIFLRDNGSPTSKAKIYQLTSRNEIPFGKYGNKLIFSRKELYEWASDQIIRMGNNSDSVVEMIKNAQKKSR